MTDADQGMQLSIVLSIKFYIKSEKKTFPFELRLFGDLPEYIICKWVAQFSEQWTFNQTLYKIIAYSPTVRLKSLHNNFLSTDIKLCWSAFLWEVKTFTLCFRDSSGRGLWIDSKLQRFFHSCHDLASISDAKATGCPQDDQNLPKRFPASSNVPSIVWSCLIMVVREGSLRTKEN